MIKSSNMIEDQTQFESSLPQKRSWFLVAAVAAFVIISIFSVYLQIRYSTLKKTADELQAKKETYSASLKSAVGTNTNSIDAALIVKDALSKIEGNKLSWSVILDKIDSTIPKDKVGGEQIVNFRTYNGAEDGKLIVSATTRTNAADPFNDIALAIHAFSQEPSFHSVFVPSITKSLTPEGATVLNFSLNFEYQKPKF